MNLKQFLFLALSIFLFFISSCKKTVQDEQSSREDVGVASIQPMATNDKLGINVIVSTSLTSTVINELKSYGLVKKTYPEINAVTMLIDQNNLAAISALAYVVAASPDAERKGSPVDALAVSDFSAGVSTWNLDAVNVTQPGVGRTVVQDGTGVFVGVIDSGLPDS